MNPIPVLVSNFFCKSKHDDLVQQAQLTHANPAYAKVRYPNGREATVSPEDLTLGPRNIVDETYLNAFDVNRLLNPAEVLFALDKGVGNRASPNKPTNNVEEFKN